MFTFGIILLIAGCVLWMWVKLSTRHETKTLGPMNVRVRNIELFLLEAKEKATAGLTPGFLCCLVGL